MLVGYIQETPIAEVQASKRLEAELEEIMNVTHAAVDTSFSPPSLIQIQDTLLAVDSSRSMLQSPVAGQTTKNKSSPTLVAITSIECSTEVQFIDKDIDIAQNSPCPQENWDHNQTMIGSWVDVHEMPSITSTALSRAVESNPGQIISTVTNRESPKSQMCGPPEGSEMDPSEPHSDGK